MCNGILSVMESATLVYLGTEYALFAMMRLNSFRSAERQIGVSY